MARGYVPIFFDLLQEAADLSDEEFGRLVRAAIRYASGDPDYMESIKGNEKYCFRFVAGQIDRNNAISDMRAKAGASKKERTETNDSKQEQTQTKTIKKFVPPTVEEVRAYCTERKNNVDPEAFVAHYTANGWKVGGRGAMKDWKAAVITWEKNDFSSKGSGKKVVAQDYTQRDYSDRQKQAEKRFETLL